MYGPRQASQRRGDLGWALEDDCTEQTSVPSLGQRSHSHKAGRAWGWWMKKKNWSRQGRERRPEGSAEGP